MTDAFLCGLLLMRQRCPASIKARAPIYLTLPAVLFIYLLFFFFDFFEISTRKSETHSASIERRIKLRDGAAQCAVLIVRPASASCSLRNWTPRRRPLIADAGIEQRASFSPGSDTAALVLLSSVAQQEASSLFQLINGARVSIRPRANYAPRGHFVHFGCGPGRSREIRRHFQKDADKCAGSFQIPGAC